MADTLKLGLLLSATDKMSRVIDQAVGKSTAKLQQLEKQSAKFAAMGAAGGALTAASGFIVKSSLDAAGEVEKYKAQLKTMLGSTEAAGKRFQEMSDFAFKTPFELSEVVEMGNQLQAIGIYSEKAMTMVGDLAAASGKPVDQVMRAVAKLKSGQKGIAVDMFRDLLITNEDWVKATGKGVSKTGEMLATTEEMMAVLPKIMQSKKFSGMMDNLSNTYQGKLSNMSDANFRLKASWGQMWMPLAMKLIPAVTSLLEKFQKWGEKHKWLVTGTIGLIGVIGGLLVAISAIGFASIGVVKGIMAFQKAFAVLKFMVFAVKFNLWQAGIAIKSWGIWTKIAAAWQWVFNASLYGCPVVWIIAGIMAVIAAVVLIVKYWKPITAFFKRLWDNIKAIFVNVWNWIKEMFFKFTILGILIKNWSKIWAFFRSVFVRFKEWGKNIIKGLVEGIMSFITAPIKAIGKIGTAIKDKFKQIFKINSPSKVFAEYGVNITTGLSEGIENGRSKSTNSIKGLATSVNSGFTSNSNVSNGIVVNYSPVINMTDGNPVERENVIKALKQNKREFQSFMEDLLNDRKRLSFA